MDTAAHQRIVDDEHLRLLRIGWFISAAANLMFVFIGAIYAFMGGMFTFVQEGEARVMGLIFLIGGGAFVLFALALSGLKALTAQSLIQRRRRVLCLVIAGISCLGIPWNTALGVLTLMTLMRPSVIAQFEANAAASAEIPQPTTPPAPVPPSE